MTGTTRRCIRWIAALCLFASARTACAGGGPENVFLVVNANSWASVTVANEFIALRKIPSINVFYVNWEGGFESTDGETFRQQILMPAIEAMEARGIYRQIDYVIYSSDFPYAIGLAKDYNETIKLQPYETPKVSINSATFLFHLVTNKLSLTVKLGVNQYMRNFTSVQHQFNRQVAVPSHGFRSWYGWGQDGVLREGGGQPYMLSTMLAMTSGRGNSVSEVFNYLRRSAAADGTFPKGTVYFTRTDDVRSTSRQDEVAAAMAELDKLGVGSRVVTTPMPMQAGDVLGVMSGVESFSWPNTGSTILPGAICDNFTSFGGILQEDASQSPLTDFLRFGAAGAAGTVVEPYALVHKFASPNIFVHYARGCSLAESYYQSLFGPAQVLIVGDPLCQPWANIPQVTVAGLTAGGKVSGTVSLQPQASFPREGSVAHYELYVDGRRASAAAADEPLVWDSTAESDGYHELRVVAIAAGPIETQGRVIVPVTVDNHGQSAVMATRPEKVVHWGEALQVAVRAPGARQIAVLNNGRMLGTIAGPQGQLKVDPRILGLGQVDLQAIALLDKQQRVIPPPVKIIVEPTAALPALNPPTRNLLPGLMLKLANERVVPVQDTLDPEWLRANGVGPDQPYIFQGLFEVPADDVYQFQIWHYGELQLTVDGRPLYRGSDGKYEQKYVPFALAAGQHRLTVSGKAGNDVKLRILFGGPGARSLNGRVFQHPKQ